MNVEPVPKIVGLNSSSKMPVPSSQSYFRFEDLPLDIRRMVYDYLPEEGFRPLLKVSPMCLHYGVCKPPLSLLLVNRFLYEEVTASLQTHIEKSPIVLLFRHSANCITGIDMSSKIRVLLDLLDTGRLYDQRKSIKKVMRPEATRPSTFSRSRSH